MMTVYTIGHSNRSLQEFNDLLTGFGVDFVADVRKMPRSRKNPQFNDETLAHALAEVDIGYVQIPNLSGLRNRAKGLARPENDGWRNPSFHAYADHMLTDEFEDGLQMLLSLAAKHHVAVMCAEAVWWRCHRQLIADALVARGVRVEHIMAPGRAEAHKLRDMCRVEGTTVTYPAASAGDASPPSPSSH